MRRLSVAKLSGIAGPPPSRRSVLNGGWETELRDHGDVSHFQLFAGAENTILRVVKAKTARYCRVLLRIPSLLERDRTIRIRYTARACPQDALEWVALLNEAPDGTRRFLHRERRQASEGEQLNGTITGVVPASYAGPYFVAFQFSTAPGDFSLERLLIQLDGPVDAASVDNLHSGQLFDAAWYEQQVGVPLSNPDEALCHYLTIGEARGLSPHPLFDPAWYARQLGSELPKGESALSHYLRVGAARGLSPHPLFDPSWYSRQASTRGNGA